MMKLNDFISKLNLALNDPSVYKSGGWGKWNGSQFEWDCVCLVKGILWGWSGIKEGHGGAVYGSNGVPDITDNGMYEACNNKSTNFSNIQVGELVHMDGHVGVYVGNGNVIEATAGWDTWKVIMSQIDKNGNRTYNGQGGSPKWTGHGFLPYVDYNSEEYFVAGNSYKLLYDKYLRKSCYCDDMSNVARYDEVDDFTKSICNNVDGYAQLKAGTVIEPLEIRTDETGRIWSSYGNCWWVCQNKDGEKQAERV